jgi:hypothetical protein
MISTPYPAMEEDDDWLNDSGPNQGGATDPLTNVEYDRIASKYSDVCPLLPTRIFSLFEGKELIIGWIQGGNHRWEISNAARRFRFFLLYFSTTFEAFGEFTWESSCPTRSPLYPILPDKLGYIKRLYKGFE